eukprot:scaffold2651_cov171-Amphora_coffeaeformis.AAC.6
MLQSNVSIKRVVSCFIVTSTQRVAVFHRVATMPTFPSHWAPCSGSVEAGETPWETADRELKEETNVPDSPTQAGLYVDVPLPSRGDDRRRIIRVYPFLVQLSSRNFSLELKGTEHDTFKFVTVSELETLEPAVPGFAMAFYHATRGRYLRNLPDSIETWRQDRVNGAATLARQALTILQSADNAEELEQWAVYMRMMRPSMVAITNALNRVIDDGQSPTEVLQEMKEEADKLTNCGCTAILDKIKALGTKDSSQRRIATFSRSSTLSAILQKVQNELAMSNQDPVDMVCAKSTPGDEGILMASDLNATCIPDEDLLLRVRQGSIDLVVVGADCLISDSLIVNKVGTQQLARVCKESNVPIWCFTDSSKIWNDIFPPPLEDIFECIPRHLLHVIMPAS